MITLSDGATTLSFKGLTWSDRSRDKALGNERVTMGLRVVTQRLVGSAGKPITLEAKFDGGRLKGWYTFAQVDQLMAWRDNAVTLTLVFDNDTRFGVIPLGGLENIEPVRQFDKTPGSDEVCAGKLIILEM